MPRLWDAIWGGCLGVGTGDCLGDWGRYVTKGKIEGFFREDVFGRCDAVDE